MDVFARGARGKGLAAGTCHLDFLIIRVYTFFHFLPPETLSVILINISII